MDPTKSVQFICTVNGHPINRIMWYKNGQPLMQLSGRVRVTSSLHKQVLTLSPLSKDDQGMYQCFGTNDWDMAHDNTQLLLGGILGSTTCNVIKLKFTLIMTFQILDPNSSIGLLSKPYNPVHLYL